MGKLVEITDGNFEQEVLSSDVPVMLDFWAEWCAPCLMIAPVVEELAEEYAGRVKIGKLNVDTNPTVAVQYGVRSIPTLLFFKKGKVVDQIVGAVHKKHIKAKLEEMLKE